MAALVITGFVNASYQRERTKLGDRHFRAGLALNRVRDLTGAAEEFRKALLFAPDNRQYELSLATALVNADRLDEAESHLEQLAQADPTNGDINLLLAEVAEKRHDNQAAIEAYQRAVYEYWPPEELNRRREARWALIELLQESGQNRDQLVGELLQLYGNLSPHSDQRLRVGTMLLRVGADAESAHVSRDILKDAQSEPPAQSIADQVGAYSTLARISFRAGDYVSARHEYQHVLKLAPDDLKTASALELTNDVIDMAPELPNISPNERLRRSGNLLKRVEADLLHCSGATETEQQTSGTSMASASNQSCPTGTPTNVCALNQRLEQVTEVTGQKVTDKDDRAAMVQQAASGLWKDRATFCGQHQAIDPALEAVLSKLEQP